jgi:hypothetical protein
MFSQPQDKNINCNGTRTKEEKYKHEQGYSELHSPLWHWLQMHNTYLQYMGDCFNILIT